MSETFVGGRQGRTKSSFNAGLYNTPLLINAIVFGSKASSGRFVKRAGVCLRHRTEPER